MYTALWWHYAAVLLVLLILFCIYRYFYYKPPIYRHPFGRVIVNALGSKRVSLLSPQAILYMLRLGVLIALLCALARVQQVDQPYFEQVRGRDIILALDISGSMQLFDDMADKRTRIEVAKREAAEFIKKRVNDPIGIVLFAATALSRVPLTLDKKILLETLAKTSIGFIDQDGTVLATGLGIAVNALKRSDAESKVIVLLTDGAPSPHDMPITPVVDAARAYGIKVYAIGVGGDGRGFISDGRGFVHAVEAPLNIELLNYIADATGGKAFIAKRPEEVKKIYEKIDNLEASERQSMRWQEEYDWYPFCLWLACILFIIELLLRIFYWRFA